MTSATRLRFLLHNCFCLWLTLAATTTQARSFFTVKERDGEWQLLDPAGKRFFLRGLNHYGDGTYMPWNLTETHGDVASWRKSLPKRLREWGFNYLPPSIGPSAVNPATLLPEERLQRQKRVTRTPEWSANEFAEVDFPFTIFLEYPRQYMSGPNLPDVFSKEFREAVDARCRDVCEPLTDNPNLIGYHFCHNPPWHPRAKSFNLWIDDIVKPGSAAMQKWIALMRRVYGSIDRWREVYGYPIESWEEISRLEQPLRGYVAHDRMLEDRETFMRLVCREWYRVYSEAVRRYDPNHLILGDRNTLHLQPLPAFAIQEMKPYIDVLSVNVMGPPNTVYGVLEQVTRHWDGPIHLADTGAGIYQDEPAKAAYTARDLAEFEEVYAGLATAALEHPQVLGFGWCGFYETPHPGGRSGLVDVATGKPIIERLEVMKSTNQRLAEAEASQVQEFSGEFQWETGVPILRTSDFGEEEWIAIKDPSIVRHNDRWHLFCTLRGHERSHAVVYSSFAAFDEAAETKPVVLPNHDGYWCAPHVFFYRPHQKWYLVTQAKDESWEPEYQAAFATTTDLSDPESWSVLQPMGAIRPPKDEPWLDFWVICDDEKAHLFFTSDNGRMWREETSLAEFPFGWSEPVLAFEGDIIEASHLYRISESDVYLNLIEAQAQGDRRYFKAYVADTLDGEWRPLAGTLKQPYAAAWGPGENVRQPSNRWTDGVSHGELLRLGSDERMEAELDAPFLFQGVLHKDRRGKAYGKIPWDLGLLKLE
ncbi:MAG: non-reducing end alpha-L-arabinofuranosidase family hydrolase [Verrucomicrobiota bacterium]